MSAIERCLIADLPGATCAQLDRHSFFGSTGFARIWESIGGTPVCWLTSDGGSIKAALPGVEFRSRPLTRFQAMPDGCYARLYSNAETEHDRQRLGRELISTIERSGYAKVYVTDYNNEMGLAEGGGSRSCETLIVDISDPNWQPPDAKLQSEIRKAERDGVAVSQFSTSAHLDGFLHLMAKTEQRHRRNPKYAKAFFRTLADLAAIDKRIKWLYVLHAGTPVASQIYFIDGIMALNWQTYSDKSFSSLKANQYLMYTAAKSLAASGVTHLNLGATPPEAVSLRDYKLKWGAVAHSYPMFVRRSWLGRIL